MKHYFTPFDGNEIIRQSTDMEIPFNCHHCYSGIGIGSRTHCRRQARILVGTLAIVKNLNFSLTATFKPAGLANIVSQAFLTSSGRTSILHCVNPGGNNPPPKEVSFGPLQGQITNIPPSDGQITASATIGPPPLPGASQICPNPNWSVAIISLLYENVVLHTQQNGVDILTFNFGSGSVEAGSLSFFNHCNKRAPL